MVPNAIEFLSFIFSCAALSFSIMKPGRKNLPDQQQIENICPCEHPASMHENREGPCHETIREDGYVRELGMWKADGLKRRCGCQVYDGPEVMPRINQWNPPPITPKDE